MTDGMIMVQWADLTGRGFARHTTGAAAPKEYWSAAERLLLSDLSQPIEGIRSTVGHPVWTLRWVQVDGRWRWCFVVQGRRGPFGVAGTCRFAFAPEQMPAVEAWQLGRAIAAADHEPPVSEFDGDWFQDQMGTILGGVTFGQAAIPIDQGPSGAAKVISAALGVLPEMFAQAWSWSTCLLQRPDDADRRVVAGRWPQEFRDFEPTRANAIDQMFRRGPVDMNQVKARLSKPQLIRGFEWWVHDASTGKRLSLQLLCGDFTINQLLLQLDQANREVTWQDVPAMLETPDGRVELEGKSDLAAEWAAHRPDAALMRLRVETHPTLARALLRGLIDCQGATTNNVLGLPTAADPEPTAWHQRLAELLTELYPKVTSRRDLVRQWVNPPGVLQAPGNLIAVGGWLQQLGITPDQEPSFFPPRQGVVLEELNDRGNFTGRADKEIQRAETRESFLLSLSDRLNGLRGSTAADVLEAATRDRKRRNEPDLRALQLLAHSLTAKAMLRADGHWILEMLTTMHRRDCGPLVIRSAMYGAIEAFLESQPFSLPKALAQECLRIGVDDHAPPEVAALLMRAHEQEAAAAPPSSVPRVARRKSPKEIPQQSPPAPAEQAHPVRAFVSRLRGGFPPAVRGYVVVSVASLAIGGAVGAAVAYSQDPAAPNASASRPAATPATSPPPPVVITLAGPASAAPDLTAADLNNFLAQYRSPKAPVKAVVVLLVTYQDSTSPQDTGPDRAYRLQDRLRTTVASLHGADFLVVEGKTADGGEAVGTLKVTLVFG